MVEPNNQSTTSNPVGRFMVAVGSVMELGNSGKILLAQRNNSLDWHAGEWEIGYGRIAQFESPEKGLRREILEEFGLKDFSIIKLLRVWHIFRGSKKAENELLGLTYHCRTDNEEVVLSDEHQQFTWVTPKEALKMISVEGIRQDIEAFIR